MHWVTYHKVRLPTWRPGFMQIPYSTKLWWIWWFIANPPKFYLPKSCQVLWAQILNELCLCQPPKFSLAIFLQFQLRQSFLLPVLCYTVLSLSEVKLRVYERDTGDMMACGSGACAAMVAGKLHGLLDDTVTMHFTDNLQICWHGNNHSVLMIGPVVHVFDGEIIV